MGLPGLPLRARYYDPATGQFLTRDPIEAVTRDPYGYVGGSPLNATDPSGEIPLLAAAALAWVAVEATLTAWDAVGTARTVLDGCASGSSKLAAMGLFAAGIVGPGAGYGRAAKNKVGSYTNTHASGKKYHGKGPLSRAKASAERDAKAHNDPVVDTDWTPAAMEKEAFEQEARRIQGDGGVFRARNRR